MMIVKYTNEHSLKAWCIIFDTHILNILEKKKEKKYNVWEIKCINLRLSCLSRVKVFILKKNI